MASMQEEPSVKALSGRGPKNTMPTCSLPFCAPQPSPLRLSTPSS